MTTINLGVNFESVKDSDKFPVLPDGTYPYYVERIEVKQSGPNSKAPGRPMLAWTLVFNHPETGNKVPLTHNTVLPWIPTGQTELDVSGVGMLVAICKNLGQPWAGTDIDPDAYIGRSGQATVSQRPKQIKDPNNPGKYINDPSGDKVNNIDKFIN